MSVRISTDLWNEISDFFARIVRPCKDCVRGNKLQCWESRCPAFKFRGIARRVEEQTPSQHGDAEVMEPKYISVEKEIVKKLGIIGRPVSPRELHLTTTNSKVNKCHAITRLVRRGVLKEIRTENGARKIFLQPNKEPKQ